MRSEKPRRRGGAARGAVAAALALALAACGPVEESATAGGAPAWVDGVRAAVGRYARQVLDEGQTPGIVVALTSREGWLAVDALGVADVKTGRPVTADTLFEIGSISKTFTALAALRLAEQGRFDPRLPVRQYLPWFEVRSDYPPITGHHLLSHTAGLPRNRDDLPASKYMAWAVREQRLVYPPGERFHYSNVGYQVLSAALEAIEHRPLAEIVTDRVLRPLAMDDTRAKITNEVRSRLAQSYMDSFDDRPVHPSHPLAEATWLEFDTGDGNVVSTAADLAKLLRMLLARGETPQGRFLSAESFELFVDAPGILEMAPGNRYGYGIVTRHESGATEIFHYGGMVGFISAMRGELESGLGAVAFVNGGPGYAIPVALYALRAMRAAQAGEPIPDPPPAADRRHVEDAGQYAGTFRSPSGDRRLEVTAEGDRLFVSSPSWSVDEKVPLETYADDAFYASHSEIEGLDLFLFRFGRGDDGKVVEVSHGEDWYVGEGYRGPHEFEVPESWRAFPGHYRSFSPWFSNFRVLLLKGELLLVTPRSPETSFRVHRLVELEPGLFQVDEEPTPERVAFDTVIDGQAQRAVWTGHPFYRFFTP